MPLRHSHSTTHTSLSLSDCKDNIKTPFSVLQSFESSVVSTLSAAVLQFFVTFLQFNAISRFFSGTMTVG